jgi:hypothetical protein
MNVNIVSSDIKTSIDVGKYKMIDNYLITSGEICDNKTLITGPRTITFVAIKH